MDNLNALFTTQSLLSLQGSVAATYLIPNVLGYIIGDKFKSSYRKWVGLVVAMALSFLVAILATDSSWLKWLVALFNGFLVFASAVGINQGVTDSGAVRLGGGQRKFFDSWF